MWYGKNSPAPAAQIDRMSVSLHPPSSKTKLPLLRPTWAPLEEPACRRREQWQQQRRLGRSASSGSLSRGGASRGAGRAVTAPHQMSSAPAWVHAWLSEAGHGAGVGASGAAGVGPGAAGALLLPNLSRRGSVASAAVASHLASDRSVFDAAARSGGHHPFAAPSRPSTASPRPAAPEAKQREVLEPTEGTPKKRNTLCDKLLLAVMSRGTAPSHRQLLLAGRVEKKGAASRFYTSYEQAEAAFHHTSHDGEMCLGSAFAEAFLILDYPYPDHTAFSEIVSNQCNGRDVLDREDFVAILWKFEEDLRGRLRRVFRDHTPGGGDLLDASLLARVLLQAGAVTMPGVADELLEDVRGEFGRPIQRLSYSQFERIYEEVLSRACLSEKEHERLCTLFEAVEDDKGTVGEQELIELLSWRDTVVQLVGGEEFIQRLAAEAIRRTQLGIVDLDLKGWLDAMEKPPSPTAGSATRAPPRATGSAFLAAARVLHEKLLRRLQATMLDMRLPIGQGSKVKPKGLMPLVEELGFYHAVDSVHDFLTALGLEHLQELSFDQVYSVVFRFACSDGLTEEEIGEIARAFRRFDVDGSGKLEVPELAPVIRWLGYQPNQYRIYCFVEEAKLEEDSTLMLDEFIHFVSAFMKHSLIAVRKTFKSREVRLQDLSMLLTLVGYEMTEGEVEELTEVAGGEPERPLDFPEFKRLERIHRKAVRTSMEKNNGCTNAEMDKYSGYFSKQVERFVGDDGQQYMTHKGMRMLLIGLFPDSSLDRQRHQRIAQLVREADADGNGVFDFEEYIWLMRKVSDIIDRDNLYQGLKLKKSLGYSRQEAKQFRDLFCIADEDMSGTINGDELVGLFGNLLKMDDEAKQELRERFHAVDDGDGELDYWEFLHFMHKIQKENWRNIGSR